MGAGMNRDWCDGCGNPMLWGKKWTWELTEHSAIDPPMGMWRCCSPGCLRAVIDRAVPAVAK